MAQGEAQVGEAVEQMQREEQVRGHAVAMRLDVHRDAGALGEPPRACVSRTHDPAQAQPPATFTDSTLKPAMRL